MKYKWSDLKDRCSYCMNANKSMHESYLRDCLSGDISDSTIFPSWLNITKIGEYGFYAKNGLNNIIIPYGVTTIESSAFASCENLTTVVVPNSVILLEGSIFTSYYSSLTDIYIHSIIPPRIYSHTFSNPTNSSFIFHVPAGSEDAYKSATNWSQYADRIVGDATLESEEE